MRYIITSNQGRTVEIIRGQGAAETYIRTLIRSGVSYSIERR
jgi:hypothetical protein